MIRKSGAEAARRAAHPSLGTAESPNYPTPEHVFFSLICLPPGFGPPQDLGDTTTAHYHTSTLPHYHTTVVVSPKSWTGPNSGGSQILAGAKSSMPPHPRRRQILDASKSSKSLTPPNPRRRLGTTDSSPPHTIRLPTQAVCTCLRP